MKKILSLTLAVMLLISAIPTAFAAEIPEVGQTTVTLVGSEESKGSYYEVEVPAQMAPGGNADITAEGFWRSTETLKVTAPEKVTLYNGDQSIDVAIQFDGINQAGNDQVDSTASANLKLAPASVKFGTWTGVIEYNVELVGGSTSTPDHGDGGTTEPSDPDTGDDGEDANLISFTINGKSYQAEEGMTWAEWAESEYDTNDEWTYMEFTSIDMCRIHSSLPGSGVIVRYNQAPLNGSEPIIAGAEYNCYDPAD